MCVLAATVASAQSGPVHRWTFDEPSGDVAFDSGSAGAVTGELGSGAARIPGVVGPGAVAFAPFDLNGYVDMDNTVAAFGTKDFSISFWVKKSPGPRFGELVGTRGAFSSGGNFVDFRGSDGGISLEIMEDGDTGRGYIPIGASVPLADGNWHHITGVRSGPTAWLYFDDALVVTGNSVDGVTANLQKVFNFTVGVNDVERAFLDLNCGCSFDDVRIYNRALSAPEIKVADDISALSTLIQGMGLPAGLTKSLTSKLAAAAAALAAGDAQTAINILGAFENEVSAQSGKKLTADQAAHLTSAANDIIAKLQS
jgi:hypothetical protein